jgi:parallel beta-helix repeat protein
MKKQLFLLALLFTMYSATGQIHIGPGQPYANIGTACTAKAIHAGDTVYLHAGTYPGYMIVDSLMGKPGKWITIRPYKTDVISIIGQWFVEVCHYTKFTGLVFNGNDSAAWVNGTIYHELFFSYNYVCYKDLSNIIVDSCKFMNLLTGPNKFTTTNTAGNVCLKFTGTDTFQVTHCLFHGNAGSEGLSMNGDRNGLVQNNRFDPPVPGAPGSWASHCKGGSAKITITQNLYINWPYGAMDIGGATGSSFFCPDTIIYETDSINFFSNITIGGQTCIRLASCGYSNIVNNTCFKSNDFTIRLLEEDANSKFSNNKIYNNIFTVINTALGSNEFYINETGGIPYTTFLLTNNLFYSYSDPTLGLSGIYQDVGSTNPAIITGSVFGDPMFNDTSKLDFSLKKGSPAIGIGLNVSSPANDYYGNSFNPKTRSIGAIEYAGLLGIETIEDVNNISVYPNPSAGTFNIKWNGAGSIQNIQVYNVLGQLVLTEKPETYSAKINLSTFPKGIYKAVLYSNKGSITTRTLALE